MQRLKSSITVMERGGEGGKGGKGGRGRGEGGKGGKGESKSPINIPHKVYFKGDVNKQYG